MSDKIAAAVIVAKPAKSIPLKDLGGWRSWKRDITRASSTDYRKRDLPAENVSQYVQLPMAPDFVTHEDEPTYWRIEHAIRVLDSLVDIDPIKRGGIPVLKGTRVTVAQILAELADDLKISELAEDMDLDETAIQELLRAISIYLDRPMAK